MSVVITPDTTVGALLAAYPELESVLIDLAPAFAKLRNPVVRRTVGKVATLEQAAKIGGVSLAAMIRRLREAAGQGASDQPMIGAPRAEVDDSGWLKGSRVVEEIDADAMLERGVHPIGKVREAVAALGQGEVVVLRSSFRPEPLIETMRRSGVMVHSSVQDATHFTVFGRPIEKAHPDF
jgi:hypothetical protein